jgi:hypothetical protein
MDEGPRRRDAGGIVFGLILLLVGGYYLLDQTMGLDMPSIDWGRLWPVILIVLGGLVVFREWRERQHR